METGQIEAGGHSVFYRRYGSLGPKIVLLHGYGPFTHSLNFKAFLETMAENYQILALDLLGHGKRSDPSTPTGFELHASILHQAAMKLSFVKYYLIGYSFGGWVSLRLASEHTKSVKGFLLVDIVPRKYDEPQPVTGDTDIPLSFRDTDSAVDWISTRIPGRPREFWEGYIETIFFREDGSWSMSSHPNRKTQLVMDGNGWGYLGKVKTPILLIRGSQSHLVSDEVVEKMRKKAHNLEVETIEGADHNLPFTHPGEFIEAVTDFISG